MNDRPFVFIGSSTEGKSHAQIIQLGLDSVCETQIWNQDLFRPGSNTLESLVTELTKFDFAILIFTPDDHIESRGDTSYSPRDNVLIELGLFIGSLGRQRTFVVHDSTANIKIPSDLAGVNLIGFIPPERGSLQTALGAACTKLELAIDRQGPKDRTAIIERSIPALPSRGDSAINEALERRVSENRERIFGGESSPPALEIWYEDLRPLVHQAIHYTMPTYFLDKDLNIIDWNVAFQLIFDDILGNLRYRHVTELIARLSNFDEVFEHGRKFTERAYKEHAMPMVDIERMVFHSTRYGDVVMFKVATQLNDTNGYLAGWSVGLIVKEIDWDLYKLDLESRIRDDKLWSVYAASYDKILNEFPPYKQLIQDVLSVIPDNADTVVDIGAGTGNATELLLQKDLLVTSIELNSNMIEIMREKGFDRAKHQIIKSSAEHLDSLFLLNDQSFDAAIMVNVLYSVENPLTCLQGVNRILKPGGYLGLSTTHSEIKLDPLLQSIKNTLEISGKWNTLAPAYEQLYEANKRIESTIAKRVTAEKYQELVKVAGFEILRVEPYSYEGAVMIIHARKRSV